MHAIQVRRTGGPEVLEYREIAEPIPGKGEALVRLSAIGVNFIDIYYRRGVYQMEVPFTPGEEGAGIVERIGPGADFVKPGDRVAFTSVPRAYAEKIVVSADRLVKLPESVGFNEGAAAMLQGITAHYLTTTTYPIGKGDTVLVHAAAGGVGLLLVQLAKFRGATVIGTVSTEEKASLAADAGADHTILYTRTDFQKAVREITGGRGVQAVYDSVGNDTFDRSLSCLAPRGYLVSFGQSSGKVQPLDIYRLSAGGSLFVTRPTIGHYIATREELLARAGELLGWVAEGRLSLRIGAIHPLAEAARAHELIESRKTTGKVLLVPA
ncbi:MAG TPA: quinone oxidoreductase [Spirochaetia bacterium]|nr:quinone oxidoreductase [Spirochaetia bacterium]